MLKAARRAFGQESAQPHWTGFRDYLTHQNKDGFSPLNSAACAGHVGVVKELLEAARLYVDEDDFFDFFINQKNTSKFTPINNAAYNKRWAVFRILFNAGANVYTRNGLKYSALDNMPKHWYGLLQFPQMPRSVDRRSSGTVSRKRDRFFQDASRDGTPSPAKKLKLSQHYSR